MWHSILRFGLLPTFLVGANALGIWMVSVDTPIWLRLAVIVVAVCLMLWAERVLPFHQQWNTDHQDTGRDITHAAVNAAFQYAGVWLLPVLAPLALFADLWPHGWPLWLQVVFAIIVLDAGVTLTHNASHRWSLLWRFHAIHHSVQRMYGLNGLMKHPVHQSIETFAGVLPLLLLGIPQPVAAAVVFAVAIQLLLQHANVDYRAGPLKNLLAVAEVHRFHHRSAAGQGDVNFGLFTTLWDHLLGTFHYDKAPVAPDALGITDRPHYPYRYVDQLMEPFRPESDGANINQRADGSTGR